MACLAPKFLGDGTRDLLARLDLGLEIFQCLYNERKYFGGFAKKVSAGNDSENHTGLHLKCHDRIVNYDEAQKLRSEVVDILFQQIPEKNWDAIMDGSVYIHGIRMLGSRKVTKGIDMGRVYHYKFLVEKDGKINENVLNELDGWELLKELSVHV